MSNFVVIAIHPSKRVSVVTNRDTARAAKYIAIELNDINHVGDYQGAIFRVVESGTVYCNQCGKTDNWDSQQACKNPVAYVDEWVCQFGLDGISKGVTA